jgi:hypothetical protein
VRRRHDGAQRIATLRLEGHLRRRCDTQADHVETFGGEPFAECPIEHVGRFAGVAADHDARHAVGAEHPCRSAAEPRGEAGGQFGECDTTDTVGAELHRANPISAW